MKIAPKPPVHTSFKDKMTGWFPLPSISIPSLNTCTKAVKTLVNLPISSLNVCTKAFKSLASKFQSTTPPLSEKRITKVDSNANNSQKGPSTRVRTLFVVALATYACVEYVIPQVSKYFAPQCNQQALLQQFQFTALNNLKAPLTFVTAALANAFVKGPNTPFKALSQVMWFAPVASAFQCPSLIGTEETPLSLPFIQNLDAFPSGFDGVTIDIPSPIPSGIKLYGLQAANVLTTTVAGAINSMAVRDNVMYIPISGTSTIKIFNTDSLIENTNPVDKIPSPPQFKKTLNTNNEIKSVKIFGNRLFATGAGTILMSWDISNDYFNPSPQSNAYNSTITGKAFDSVDGNYFGCVSDKEFCYVDATNTDANGAMVVTGRVSLNGGFLVVATPGNYFVATNSIPGTIRSFSSTSSSTSIGSFTFPGFTGITNMIYDDRGYLIVSTNSKLTILDVRDPYNMSIAQQSGGAVLTFFPYGNFLFFNTFFATGTQLANRANITNLVFNSPDPSTSAGILPGINPSSYFSCGKFMIFKAGDNLNFVALDQFGFTGTPVGGSQGTYSLRFRATSITTGQLNNNTVTCPLVINPIIVTARTLPDLYTAVGRLFNAIIPFTTFSHGQGSPFGLSMSCTPPGPATGLNLDPITGKLTGTPQVAGDALCTVRATDTRTPPATATTPFTLHSTNGLTLNPVPKVVQALIGQNIRIDSTASSIDPARTFTYTISDNFPSSLTFNNGIISGNITNNESYDLTVTATVDQTGISSSQSFTLRFVQPGPPVFPSDILTPQGVNTNSDFEFNMPALAVNTLFNETIRYTAVTPDWMELQGTKFRGRPPYTAKPWDETPYPIYVYATQTFPNGQSATGMTRFNVVVGGVSLITVILTSLSAASLVFGGGVTYVCQRRKYIYNKHLIEPGCKQNCANVARAIVHYLCGPRCCCKTKCKAIEFFKQKLEFSGKNFSYDSLARPNDTRMLKIKVNGRTLALNGKEPKWITAELIDGKTRIFLTDVPDNVETVVITEKDDGKYYVAQTTLTRTNSGVTITSPGSAGVAGATLPGSPARYGTLEIADGKRDSPTHSDDKKPGTTPPSTSSD